MLPLLCTCIGTEVIEGNWRTVKHVKQLHQKQQLQQQQQ